MVSKITTPPTQNEVINKVNELVDDKQDTLVSGTNIKTINGTSLLGSGNIDIQGGGSTAIPYGESTSAADAVQKEVTISGITSLSEGQIIIVKPTITSTVANSTLKLNNFSAYPMLYGTAAITTSTDSVVWSANYPSWFRFDGSNWVFLGHGIDNNTTYSAMSVSEGTTGTATTARVMRADRLKQIIQGTTLTGLSTSTNSAVVATDTITVGIGKLQAEVNNAVMKSATAQQTIALSSGTGTTALGVTSKSTSSYISFSGTGGWLASFGIGSDKKPTIYDGSSHTIAYTSDIPTVNNATLTIQKNGSNVATFTANASSNVTANISVPNTVSSVSSSSTNAEAVGAKLFYDTVGNIETALHRINSGGGITEMVNLTVNLTGSYQSGFSKLTINNNNYSLSDFNNGIKTIQVPKNETLNWSVTVTSYSFEASPPSGTLNLSSDSTLTINIRQVEPT